MSPISIGEVASSSPEREAAEALLKIAASFAQPAGLVKEWDSSRGNNLVAQEKTIMAPISMEPSGSQREAAYILLQLAGLLHVTSDNRTADIETVGDSVHGNSFDPQADSVQRRRIRTQSHRKTTDEHNTTSMTTRKELLKDDDRYSFLKEQIKAITAFKLQEILAGCTSEELPMIIEEINNFVLSVKAKVNNMESHNLPLTPSTARTSCSPLEIAKEEDKENSNKRVLKERNSSNDDLVPIGDGHAAVPRRLLRHMQWNSHTNCTRKLLSAIFPREVLATHSLTGKPSPAFPNKAAKKQLDPLLVNDVVQTVMSKCGVTETEVRTCITTKCADECKMARMRKKIIKSPSKNVQQSPSSSSDEN